MKDNPVVSVLMPVYNCESYIKEAIDSILNQTFADFEFIIIDDCSTDNTISIVNSYNDARINLIIKSKNSGISECLNYGLKIAKGKFIARMDGDDISLPERFDKQVKLLEANPSVLLCGSWMKYIGSDEIIKVPEYSDDISIAFLQNNCIFHPSVMMRKSILVEHNIAYDKNCEPAEDFDLWVKLLNYGKLYNLQKVLLFYRIHQNQISSVHNKKQLEFSNMIKIKHFNKVTISANIEEYKTVHFLISKTKASNINDVIDYCLLLSKYKKANKAQKVFNEAKLNILLNQEVNTLLSYCFFNQIAFNKKLLSEYLKFQKKNFHFNNFNLHLKFILKCLYGYRIKNIIN